MFSSALESNGSCEGSCSGCDSRLNMRNGSENSDSQTSGFPSVTGATSAITFPRSGSSGSNLSKKLLQSISAQFRRSFSSMGGGRACSENVRKGFCGSNWSEKDLETKVAQGIERIRALGASEETCQDLRNHFARLPARYTSNVDLQRHEDVLLHMNLLNEARKEEARGMQSSSETPLPQIHVRKVQLTSGLGWFDTQDSCREHGVSKSIGIPRIPKPTFGSSSNLAGLLGVGPRVHPSGGHSRSASSSPALVTSSRTHSPMFCDSNLHAPFGAFTNPLEMEDDSDLEETHGYEITLATSDKFGILGFFSNALSSYPLQLNIREAHVFSTTDGMALEVFVVDGWPNSEADNLKQAILQVFRNHFAEIGGTDLALKAKVDALAYEDWTIDFKSLEIGERLGGGSSGRLYRGKYLSQDVAIKIIELDYATNFDNYGSGALRSVQSAELLQMFMQEVSIMRIVRQKNVVQFIGACSSWPKLCIVTELMSGGSVRDVLQKRGCGLDLPVALKVLRDAARGMDFIHQRGIVHRDLKAANLLIDEHDVVKVCDFGVARLKPAVACNFTGANWKGEMTAETGTYRWMAPEVLEHRPYDHKADVYSFGIMIWEVLTGEIPYAGLTPLQAGVGVVQRNLRPEMPLNVPEKVRSLAERCWHQDPDMRPDFSETLRVLEDLVNPPPVKKSPLFGMKRLVNFHL